MEILSFHKVNLLVSELIYSIRNAVKGTVLVHCSYRRFCLPVLLLWELAAFDTIGQIPDEVVAAR